MLYFVFATLAFGLIGWLIHWMFVDYMPDRNPLLIALGFALLPLSLLVAIWGGIIEACLVRKSIQKMKESGRVELV